MNLIVAVDSKWGIGRDNGLLAALPQDMKYFKEHTTGKAVVMGRRTLESMPHKRGLPNRENFVLTSNPNFAAEGCTVINSEAELLDLFNRYGDDLFLIGGATLYNKYYKFCDTLYITKIDAELNADTFIVNIDEDDDYEVASESEAITENGLTYRWLVYRKK